MRDKDIAPPAMIALLEEHFIMLPEIGSIIWKNPPKNHSEKKWSIAGRKATTNGKTYIQIRLNGRSYIRSRLIFLWVNKRWPKDCIDHINGDSEDDRIVNLREATVQQNNWNHKARKKGSSLPMGVRKTKCGKYNARFAYNGQQIHIGNFHTPELAHLAYITHRRWYYGEFA